MNPNGKFIMRINKKTEEILIEDIETHRKIHLNNKEEVKQLVDLMNTGYLIIKDKWGI